MVQIQEYRFGYIKISGKTYTHDLKIIGNIVIPNWWRSEGHKVLQRDIKDILEHGVEIIVIGQGDPGLMKVDPSLKNYLKKQKIKLIEKPTKDAISEFNRLYKEGRKVGAGFHLTC
ncbi:Mth938-like domain-containing protein [Desulfothermus sp.]